MPFVCTPCLLASQNESPDSNVQNECDNEEKKEEVSTTNCYASEPSVGAEADANTLKLEQTTYYTKALKSYLNKPNATLTTDKALPVLAVLLENELAAFLDLNDQVLAISKINDYYATDKWQSNLSRLLPQEKETASEDKADVAWPLRKTLPSEQTKKYLATYQALLAEDKAQIKAKQEIITQRITTLQQHVVAILKAAINAKETNLQRVFKEEQSSFFCYAYWRSSFYGAPILNKEKTCADLLTAAFPTHSFHTPVYLQERKKVLKNITQTVLSASTTKSSPIIMKQAQIQATYDSLTETETLLKQNKAYLQATQVHHAYEELYHAVLKKVDNMESCCTKSLLEKEKIVLSRVLYNIDSYIHSKMQFLMEKHALLTQLKKACAPFFKEGKNPLKGCPPHAYGEALSLLSMVYTLAEADYCTLLALKNMCVQARIIHYIYIRKNIAFPTEFCNKIIANIAKQNRNSKSIIPKPSLGALYATLWNLDIKDKLNILNAPVLYCSKIILRESWARWTSGQSSFSSHDTWLYSLLYMQERDYTVLYHWLSPIASLCDTKKGDTLCSLGFQGGTTIKKIQSSVQATLRTLRADLALCEKHLCVGEYNTFTKIERKLSKKARGLLAFASNQLRSYRIPRKKEAEKHLQIALIHYRNLLAKQCQLINQLREVQSLLTPTQQKTIPNEPTEEPDIAVLLATALSSFTSAYHRLTLQDIALSTQQSWLEHAVAKISLDELKKREKKLLAFFEGGIKNTGKVLKQGANKVAKNGLEIEIKLIKGGTSATRSTAKIGKKIHNCYGISYSKTEGILINKRIKGCRWRPDIYDRTTGTIYELKPNNIQQIRKGIKQLQKYATDLKEEGYLVKKLVLALY